MEFDSLFFIAAQSSLILGLVHGINPCGHSWIVLAPFVTGEKNGKRVSALTVSFILGTTVACLLIGLTLGAVSQAIPGDYLMWAERITAGIIIAMGLVLIVKPELLHSHDHEHDHDHRHSCSHSHVCDGDHHNHHEKILPHSLPSCHHKHESKPNFMDGLKSRMTIWAIFTIGFVNMIIPCPTVAVMYKYAFESGNYMKSVTVFGIYAVATGIAVGAVIFSIFKISGLLNSLNNNKLEAVIMRLVGVITVGFGWYSLIQVPQI